MPRDFSRGRKVADLVQRELALLVQREVRDPRLGMITLSGVKVSRDLAFADVYFTMLGCADSQAAEALLNETAGFLRAGLAQALKVRTTPRLRFHFDKTLETGIKVSQAIDAALALDKSRDKSRDKSGRLEKSQRPASAEAPR